MRISFTDQRLTAHGGMVVWSQFLHQSAFRTQLAQVLPHAPKSNHAYDPADVALGFLGGILSGADKLSRIAYLRQDPAIPQVLGIEAVPSQSTLSRFLATFRQSTSEGLTALHRWAARRLPSEREGYTLDLDSSALQHEDGHSHILAATIPNCISYDPTFAHEVAVIMQHGLKRMVEKQENVFYYLTLLNENYPMPGLKAGTEEQIIKGMYLIQQGEGAKKAPRVNLLGSGTILRESIAARDLLANDWGVAANVWSCPSFNELTRDGQNAERYNLLHPTENPKVPFVSQQLEPYVGPVVASTDYMKAYAEQIRSFIPKGRTYKVLGTDGFGRSDFRSKLREHFEVNRHYIVVAALKALSEDGAMPVETVAKAIQKYQLLADKINPLHA